MASLKSISINGFRSIKEMECLDLAPLNVLIGANGAGKSNLIAFLKMLHEMANGRLQQFVGTNGRASSLLHLGPKVSPVLDFQLNYVVTDHVYGYTANLVYTAGESLYFTKEAITIPVDGKKDSGVSNSIGGSVETQLDILQITGGMPVKALRTFLDRCLVYQFHDTSTTARIRRSCYIDDHRRLSADAGNLAAIIYLYGQTSKPVYQRIVSTIKKVMPDFGGFDIEQDRFNPRDLRLNWRKQGTDYLFGPHQLSDGTLRAMALITLFLQPEGDLPELIVVDEPELGLHPHALEIVAGLIRAASVKTQVIVATQSTAFLDHFEPAEIIVVESRDGCSDFRRLDADDLKNWLEDYSIGELWQRNVLGGGPLP